jgi:phosphate transport system substrate-binding protein
MRIRSASPNSILTIAGYTRDEKRGAFAMTGRILLFGALAALLATLVSSCGPSKEGGAGTAAGGSEALGGTIKVDGSSTVYPITEAVAEEFGREHPGVRVTVGISGTGGGFKKFTIGETDISDASRPIKQIELGAATSGKIQFVELPIAYDGLSVLVNRANDWCDSLTVADLKKIWEPGSKVRTWADVRPGWPNREIKLYGPGVDSGTFDYFTEAICGEEGAARPDFSASEDDNVLVQGIAGDKDALGFFGYAYYAENKDKLKLVGIDGGAGPVLPSTTTINDGTYQPLSRPLFIYVSVEGAKRPEVEAFVTYYLDNAAALVTDVGYVPMPERLYTLAKQRFADRKTGSIFGGSGAKEGVSVEQIMQGE